MSGKGPKGEGPFHSEDRNRSVQKVSAIERVPLDGLESGIANDAAQLFFGRTVGDAGCPYNVLFKHDRAYVIAAKLQTELADFQSLSYPTVRWAVLARVGA